MQLDWERDVRPAAEEEARRITHGYWDRDSMAADLLSITWELLQEGREFESVRHVLSVAKLRIRKRLHLDKGRRRSIDGGFRGDPGRGRRVTTHAPEWYPQTTVPNTPESDGRLEGWLAALTPRQAELCRKMVMGWTLYRVAQGWGVARNNLPKMRQRVGARLRKLGVVA